ncbi:hypothetical protein [Archangium violaceum]|uniref:hypothetical protein n=1 Tax=Archangium violaceum TaxID=83451 RepID=UPI001EF15C0E|nr:hypothetical protein [Archangium violaceum]
MGLAGHAEPVQICEPNHTARPLEDVVVMAGVLKLAVRPFFWPLCASMGWVGSAPTKAEMLPAM